MLKRNQKREGQLKMKMMIHKLLFFSGIVFIISSCKEIRTELVYSGSNGAENHSRGLDVNEVSFLVGGKNGAISLFDSLYIQDDGFLDNAEDIRDVKILSDGTLIYMNSGENGIIWKTKTGLNKPIQVHYKKGEFLDGMDFWNDKNGVAYGDPIDGKFVVLISEDYGGGWVPINYDNMPYALPNEAGFAASGTGIAAIGEEKIIFGTGMADTARLFISEDKGKSWTTKPTPIKSGDSYGIYSLCFWGANEGLVVGGSYKYPEDTTDHCFYTIDGGNSWLKAGNGLGGYTSCIDGNTDGSFLVATGRVGTYYSLDKGLNWSKLFDKSFYTVKVTEDHLYFCGKNGVVEVHRFSLNSKN
jgi:photosystem II stability/assembly factor-like uncharacterized protein